MGQDPKQISVAVGVGGSTPFQSTNFIMAFIQIKKPNGNLEQSQANFAHFWI
jgi:hypothetical protein